MGSAKMMAVTKTEQGFPSGKSSQKSDTEKYNGKKYTLEPVIDK